MCVFNGLDDFLSMQAPNIKSIVLWSWHNILIIPNRCKQTIFFVLMTRKCFHLTTWIQKKKRSDTRLGLVSASPRAQRYKWSLSVPANMYFAFAVNVTNDLNALHQTPKGNAYTGWFSSEFKVLRHAPVFESHSRITPSKDPETTIVPSFEKSTVETGSEWAAMVMVHVPVLISQSFTLSS